MNLGILEPLLLTLAEHNEGETITSLSHTSKWVLKETNKLGKRLWSLGSPQRFVKVDENGDCVVEKRHCGILHMHDSWPAKSWVGGCAYYKRGQLHRDRDHPAWVCRDPKLWWKTHLGYYKHGVLIDISHDNAFLYPAVSYINYGEKRELLSHFSKNIWPRLPDDLKKAMSQGRDPDYTQIKIK